MGLQIKDKMTSSRQRVCWIKNLKRNQVKNGQNKTSAEKNRDMMFDRITLIRN
jgi:hypothetical protein